ncbi:MAG: terminase large subunit domain-containing protein [Polyangiaceae bacterium]
MLTIVKRTEEELDAWVATEAGFISAFCRYDDEPITLEPYQLHFLENTSRFRWVTKARQVGYSFLIALEALARCHLRPKHTTVFVSYNLSDATEKILVARQVYEDLPLAFQKKLVTDSKMELAFESNSDKRGLSRIISHPSKAPRGKKGDVVLDELAHYVADREVYRGSTALILRSAAQLTGCSTPQGRRGIFWEVATEELRPYRHHWRQEVPWWLCRFFCHDVRSAARDAPSMTTEERVARFGNDKIVEQLDSLTVDDFQAEFECSFVDESYSYYPYDLILPCTHDDLRVAEDVAAIPAPSGRLVAGFDVGRTRDRSELAVFDEVDGDFTCVYLRSFGQVAFAEQEGELRRLLNTVPIARLSIDRTGIGMNLAENLEREFPQVVAENFTNESKERWATDFKILLQRRAVRLPRHRDIVAQIHSIKRRVLASGKVSFDAEKTRSGHADKFWAVALACQKERTPGREPVEIGVRVIGGEARRILQTPTLPFEEEILIEPLSADPAALEALSATLRLLGADLARRQNGEPICHRGLCWVAAPVERAGFVRHAILQQGYVRRIIT